MTRVAFSLFVILWMLKFLVVKWHGFISVPQLTLKDPLVGYLNFLFDCLQENLVFAKKLWFIDSGCSRHITRDASMFIKFDEKKRGHVTYEDNTRGGILGEGIVRIPP